ncbi:sensor histidine kinase [uncultured Clostridium sp.]|uniref:ATP-binding protein n=1 Tax=uncultured Clostridium sp. TaxID=59620 RepID=UPI0028ED6B40|nr:sensor histidine kinase [uncultured Clostridium sp.]
MVSKIRVTAKTKICLKNTIVFSALISTFAQIYIYPFNSRFVLGIGVIVIGLVFSTVENIYPLGVGVMAGVLTAFMRSIGSSIYSYNYSAEVIMQFIPAAIFYISYGILDTFFPLYKKNKSIPYLYLSLVCFDVIGNFMEIIIRNMISLETIKIIIITALIRALVQCLAFLIYNYQKLYIKKAEHQKRYAELNLMVSRIYAETFYLQKSTNDLNNVMKEAYNLYEITKGTSEFSTKALKVAQNAHEIRKNNDRVLRGINQLVENVEKTEFMSISEIFSIISDNTKRQIESINSSIYIEFKIEKDHHTKRYYDIFAILNNLIINAIEACEDNNVIKVTGEILEKDLLLMVSDDGSGIEKEVLPYIFNVGFSTKFNKDTGAMSTGIGLCHVKNLIEDLKGTVDVKSNINRGTTFIIKIPTCNL